MKKPMTGEATMAITVLVVPALSTTPGPAAAIPAPSSPPISAWLDDEGMPFTQVSTFQNIAPTSAPNTTAGVTVSGSTMPLPTVSATCSPTNQYAAKLPTAANSTAINGDSSRVATTVAMALAASCMPLRKSNASASATSPISSGKARE